MTDGFYTLQEVVELLQLSKITIYRYIKAGKIKAYKFGKSYRIKKSDYETFLETYRVKHG